MLFSFEKRTNMNILVSLVLFISVSVYADADMIEKCFDFFSPDNLQKNCCNLIVVDAKKWEPILSADVHSCTNPDCYMENLGLVGKDSKVNETAVDGLLNTYSKKYPETEGMVKRIRAYCYDRQYEDYAISKATSDAINFLVCAYINSIVECTDWKTGPECSSLQSNAKDCKSAMDNM